jgi:predicted secreted hydrolase
MKKVNRKVTLLAGILITATHAISWAEPRAWNVASEQPRFERDAAGQPLYREEAGWRAAVPGWEYDFPRDHFAHPDFKTEWWYFTGHLYGAENGKEYGFQLTFFRQGIIPPPDRPEDLEEKSRWITPQMSFAHFAISEVSDEQFHFEQVVSRGALGEAGFGEPVRKWGTHESAPLAWIKDWRLEADLSRPDGPITYFMTAQMRDGTALHLRATPAQPPVFHGADGVSQKSEGLGRGSHYYSWPRLELAGSLVLGEGARRREIPVTGEGWFDQEWATNQLAADQVGWDWFSLQFEDGSELMIYQLRLADGSADPISSGTYIAADGEVTPVSRPDFELIPLRTWKSAESGGVYPLDWRIKIPKLNLDITTRAAFETQELVLNPIIYWEGAVNVSPTNEAGSGASGKHGKGYMELTGYASPIEGMRGSN